MNVAYWITVLKHDPEARRGFEEHLQKLISESLNQFKATSSMEQVSKLQGKLEVLEKLQNEFNKEQLQEREHVLYEQRFGKSSG